jgi:AraC-like DNA-binding protein
MFYTLSTHNRIDVKWADRHMGDGMFYQTPHANPYFNLIMVTEGPVYLQAVGDNMTLQSGEMVLLEPWEQHGGWRRIGDNSGFFWLQFEACPALPRIGEWTNQEIDLKKMLAGSNLRTGEFADEDKLLLPRRYLPSNQYELLVLLERIVHGLKFPQGYFRFRASLVLGQFLELLADDWLHHHHAQTSPPTSYLTYRKLLLLLHERFCDPLLNKAGMERALDRNSEYLSHVFKQFAGMTIVEYIQSLRLQLAKHLLRSGDKPIQEIAGVTGFADPFYFSRLFKKSAGITPTQYREAHRSDKENKD